MYAKNGLILTFVGLLEQMAALPPLAILGMECTVEARIRASSRNWITSRTWGFLP
jgi:hypothetical protein